LFVNNVAESRDVEVLLEQPPPFWVLSRESRSVLLLVAKFRQFGGKNCNASGIGDEKRRFPGVCSPIWRLKNISQSGLFARAWRQKNVISGGAFATLATEKGWFGSGLASQKWRGTTGQSAVVTKGPMIPVTNGPRAGQ
jgi:hypothetical protein